MKIDFPAIVLFAYNRPKHLLKTLISLNKNYLSSKFELFVFCDGPKTKKDFKRIILIKKILSKKYKFKKINITCRSKNLGLAKSIISGVTEVLSIKKSAIVIEDDLIFNKNFLNYMQKALNYFYDNKNVGSISGYSYTDKFPQNYKSEIYFSLRHASWGWGTWRTAWNKMKWSNNFIEKHIYKKNFKNEFNFAGEDMYNMLNEQLKGNIDTWDIIFNLNCHLLKKYCVCPKYSLVKNIGLDGTGTHCKKNDKVFDNYTEDKNYSPKIDNIQLNFDIIKNIKKSFHTTIFKRILLKFKKFSILFKNNEK
jgi:GT2 family glycosyltransferase